MNDVAFNRGPFISPKHFHEFITPYLPPGGAHQRRGVIPFVHTDGNIMPSSTTTSRSGRPVSSRSTHGRHGHRRSQAALPRPDGPDGQRAVQPACRTAAGSDPPIGALLPGTRLAGRRLHFGTSNTIFPGMPLENYHYML